MDTNLVLEGVKFMVLGMGTVYLFLMLMIVMMNLMSSIIHKLFPEPQPKISQDVEHVDAQKNQKIVAAITAAIIHHRQG
jgi:oxaloacetate decarboxylase gamma subunit